MGFPRESCCSLRVAFPAVLFALVCCLVTPAGAEPLLRMAPGDERVPLGAHLELLEDPDGSLAFEDVLRPEHAERFVPSTEEVPGYGFSSSVYWARIRVENGTDRDRWLLQLAVPLTDWIRVYSALDDDRYTVREAGLKFVFGQREVEHRTFLFRYEIPPGSARTFYVRLENEDVMQFNLVLWTPEAFGDYDHDEQLVYGMYYGIILVMIFYNLFIFFAVRDRSYAYYVFYATITLLFMLSQNGFAYELLWPNQPWMAGRVNIFLVPVYLISFVLFTRNYLETRKTLPLLDRLSPAVYAVSVILAVLAWFADHGTVAIANTLLALSVLPVMIGGSVVAYWRGYKPALYYIVAFTLFILGALMYSLRALGLVEVSFLTAYGIQIGQVLEVALLSIGLGNRINLLKQEGEAARAASRLKSAFLANVSHEMRTPLNVVLGMGDLLGDAKLNDEYRRYLQVMRGAGESLLALINDLLDISRVEAGGLTLKRAPFNPTALLEQCREMLAHQARARELALETHMADGLPELVYGDPDRLRQVLVNLIGNAIKFTESGGISVYMESGRRPSSPDEVELLVRVVDTGIGIPADQLEVIFESFRQVDEFETRRFEGAGLGLSISRELVRLMGGEISARSKAGEGSTFSFNACFERAGDEAIKDNRASSPGRVEFGPPRSVLLVDDNADNRMLFAAYLKKTAHDVDFAVNGIDAVERFQARPYDIVFMDIQMPELDGLGATRRIRAWEQGQLAGGERSRKVPIFALSAHALAEEVERSLEAGCDGHIAKPVRREEILDTIAGL